MFIYLFFYILQLFYNCQSYNHDACFALHGFLVHLRLLFLFPSTYEIFETILTLLIGSPANVGMAAPPASVSPSFFKVAATTVSIRNAFQC